MKNLVSVTYQSLLHHHHCFRSLSSISLYTVYPFVTKITRALLSEARNRLCLAPSWIFITPCDGLALSRGYLLSRLLAIMVQSYSTGPRLIERVVFSLTGFIMTVQVNKWNIIYLNCWERLRHNRWAPGHNWSSHLHTKWKQLWNFYSWTGFEPITSAWCSSNLAIKPSVSWSTSLWVRNIPVDGGEHINHSLPSAQICPRTLFPRQELEENCDLRRTDNVQGQISKKCFAPNDGYCVYYPSKLSRNTRSFENWGILIIPWARVGYNQSHIQQARKE